MGKNAIMLKASIDSMLILFIKKSAIADLLVRLR